MGAMNLLQEIAAEQLKAEVPEFRAGDTVKVHTRIVEGNKERIQIFEGVVIKRPKSLKNPSATFTVRKVSYNIGVERTFFVHSPRVEKIEIVRKGMVRRGRLFYLRERRGKSARIKSQLHFETEVNTIETGAKHAEEEAAPEQPDEQQAKEETAPPAEES